MNELKKIIRKYGFNVKKYKQNGKIHIISTDSGTYCIKKKQREDLDKILKSELTNLINLVRQKALMFDKDTIKKYNQKYNELKFQKTETR